MLFAVAVATPLARAECLTFHYGNARLGANARETALNSTSVSSSRFAHLWTNSLDGPVRGSPLVVAQGAQDLIIAATDRNSVFALATATGKPVWQRRSLCRPINEFEFSGSDFGDGVHGILGTPVIDRANRTLYVSALRRLGLVQQYLLFALDIADGRTRAGYPITLGGTDRGATFRAGEVMQRGALTLVNGWVLVPFGGRGDNPPWRGWLLGVNTRKPKQRWAFCGSPQTDGAGIWSGGGVSADAEGNIYAVTGNGTYDLDRGGQNAAQSVLRLRPGQPWRPLPADFYTPANYAFLDEQDEDLGGATANVLPPQPGRRPNLLFTGGKDGCAYLLDRANLGGVGGDRQHQRYFCPDDAPYHEGIRSTSCYLDAGDSGRFIFVAGDQEGPDGTRGIAALRLALDPVLGETRFSRAWTAERQLIYPSAPVVTSEGTKNALLWVVETGPLQGRGDSPSSLHAYDALTGRECLDTAKIPSGSFLGGRRFSAPTVCNGRAFVGANGIVCFGLKP